MTRASERHARLVMARASERHPASIARDPQPHPRRVMDRDPQTYPRLSDFDRGVLVGVLVGEGSFGGDGRQPHITLRMHVRHESLFRWLIDRFPDTRLYGPYTHGGRSYFQWMARGRALV